MDNLREAEKGGVKELFVKIGEDSSKESAVEEW